MHILIAPNAFKNSLSATDAADAIKQGLLRSGLRCSMRCFPIGDGGDGTASLLIDALSGRLFETEASDALGRKVTASMGFIEFGQTAVIEMAEISGLKRLKAEERDPLHTSSFGTGELIRVALDKGARKIILGIGGSATVDGGCGLLQALGIRFLDSAKQIMEPVPENLLRLDSIDVSKLDKRIRQIEFIVLCDVENPLLGEHGAAVVFSPQKGAKPEDVLLLERALMQFREVCLRQKGKDLNAVRHGGAAGGAAAGLAVFLNARLVQGIEYFLDLTGFDEALEKADLLITGEGSIDIQTLEGKGPFGVARRAKKKNIPVIGLAGQVPIEAQTDLDFYFDVLMAISHQPESIENAIGHTTENLQRCAEQAGRMLAFGLT
jgi:glycerate 2-kinase